MTTFMRVARANVRIGGTDDGYRLSIYDFAIKLGQIVLVAGSSGSGKSLFLELVGLARRPENAEHFAISARSLGEDPVDVAALWEMNDVARLAGMRVRSLGFMVPSSLLASHTIKQNLELSSQIAGVEPEIGLGWARRLGLGALIDRRPGELSFGQRHRAILARALASDPQCLIADEPTGPLDAKNSGELADCLVEFAAGSNRAVIVASHEEGLFHDIAAQTYRVIELPEGSESHARLVRVED